MAINTNTEQFKIETDFLDCGKNIQIDRNLKSSKKVQK